MKHCRAEASRDIAAPADALWATIEKMTGMEDWYPDLIQSSRVDAKDGVTHRVCTMANGGVLEERILLRDAHTRTFVYSVDSHPLPARGVVGCIRVDDLGGPSRVTWDSQFMVDDAVAGEVLDRVRGLYAAGLDSLAKHHGA